MSEIRVYAINVNELEENVKDSLDSIGWSSIADWEFMEMAEEQRNVWALSDFEEAFNKEQINTDIFYIRII